MVRKAKKGGQLVPHGFLSAPTMKGLASCFSEHAVRVSDTSCSGSSSGGSSSSAVAVVENAAAASSSSSSSSALSAVTSLYRTRLSTSEEFLVRVTWSKTRHATAAAAAVVSGPSLSIAVDEVDCQISRKKKGSRSYISGGGANVAVYWDYSSCRYAVSSGPEPVEEFYVVVIVNAEYALLLGDLSADYVKRFEEEEAAAMPVAEFSMVSRREQVVVSGALHSTTMARFCIAGGIHEITVRCTGDGWEAKDAELWVAIDKKRVVHVRRLRWNFRGNQTVFIDGMPVDMMWDVHSWLSAGGRGRGQAVFLFRTRSALESRLWLEEEKLQKEEKGISGGFSLLIEASKNSVA